MGESEQNQSMVAQKKPFITRRGFLRACIGFAVAGGEALVALDIASKGALHRLGGKLIREVPEALLAQAATKRETGTEPVFSPESFETLDNNESFYIIRPKFTIGDKHHRFEPVMFFLKPNTNCKLQEIPDYHREHAILHTKSPSVLGPIGWVQGDFDRAKVVDAPVVTPCDPSITSDGKRLGPSHINIRFPKPELLSSTGGIQINGNGQIIVSSYEDLQRALQEEKTMTQMLFYLDEHNYKQTLQEEWDFHGLKCKIGNSHYYYAAYFEIPINGKRVHGCMVNDKSHVSLTHFVESLRCLSDSGTFKLALADGGNGSSVYYKDAQGKIQVFGRDGANDHLIPFSLLIQ